jgi:hypothetical protein
VQKSIPTNPISTLNTKFINLYRNSFVGFNFLKDGWTDQDTTRKLYYIATIHKDSMRNIGILLDILGDFNITVSGC